MNVLFTNAVAETGGETDLGVGIATGGGNGPAVGRGIGETTEKGAERGRGRWRGSGEEGRTTRSGVEREIATTNFFPVPTLTV